MNKKNMRIAESFAMISQVGISFVVYIVGALFIGKFIDSKLSTSPLFLIGFIILGVIAAFFNIFKMLMHLAAKEGEGDKWKK